MLTLALRSVRHNPKRLLLTAIAVALGVSLVSATHIFTNSLSSGFSGLFNEIYSSVDLVVEPEPDRVGTLPAGQSPLSDDVLEGVLAIDGVELAGGGTQGMGDLLMPDAVNTVGMGAGTLIYNWTGIPEVDRSTVLEGRAPQAVGEAVLDIDTIAATGYGLGDTVYLSTSEGIEEFALVGTIRFGEDNSLQGVNVMNVVLEDARMLAGGADGYDVIEVLAADGANLDAIEAAVAALLPDGTRVLTGEEKAAEHIESIDEILQYVDVFSLAFAVIALFVGSYIIVNTFRIIVTQRTREFGLLRAVGVTGQQVRRMILLEGLTISVIASIIGIAMGWLGALGIVAVVELTFGELFGTVTLPGDAVLWGLGVGLIVTLVSAIMPAIHASRISPMEALRESATQSKKSLRSRNTVGGAMTLGAIALIAIGLMGSLARPYIYVGTGAVVLILGVTLLAAQLLAPAASALRGPLTRVFSVDGKLAANNIHREPRRSANTAAALMIGVMLLALVATFTESAKTMFTSQFQGSAAELFVFTDQGDVPQRAIDIIAHTDGVASVARMGWGDVNYEGESRSMAVLDAELTDGLFEIDTDRPLADIGDGVFIDPSMVDAGVEVGDMVTLSGPGGTATLEVTGLYLPSGDAHFWVDWHTGTRLLSPASTAQALVDFEQGADFAATKQLVRDNLIDDYPLVQANEPSELEQLANDFIDLLLGVISALLGSALIIAILGVANTLLLSVTERTREIGLLRAVGLRKRSVWRMITVESMVMAIFGTLLGVALGVSLGSALVLALEDFGFAGVTIPWMWMGVYTVLAAIAGVLAAIWPAKRASRLDILEAIASE